MKTIFLIVVMAITSLSYSQNEQTRFQAHQNLIGGVWKVDTTWGDGTPHKLFIAYEVSLDGAILKTRTHGNISKEGYQFGLRNEGVRYIDNDSESMKFYEFDVFGGFTKGDIKYHDKDIYYIYDYKVENEMMTLTDAWEYLDDDTYVYIVGIYNSDHDKWEQKFINAKIKRSKN